MKCVFYPVKTDGRDGTLVCVDVGKIKSVVVYSDSFGGQGDAPAQFDFETEFGTFESAAKIAYLQSVGKCRFGGWKGKEDSKDVKAFPTKRTEFVFKGLPELTTANDDLFPVCADPRIVCVMLRTSLLKSEAARSDKEIGVKELTKRANEIPTKEEALDWLWEHWVPSPLIDESGWLAAKEGDFPEFVADFVYGGKPLPKRKKRRAR